jgi:hypothetical protein
MILQRAVETGGWSDEDFERLKASFAYFHTVLGRRELQ